jgi:predicted RNA binding protein YcfA (HicA-like mRNA interferase family)
MKAVSGRDFARAIEGKGWVFLRAHGSHHIYGREGGSVRLAVPQHENHPLKTGLLHHLMKLADLTEEDLR